MPIVPPVTPTPSNVTGPFFSANDIIAAALRATNSLASGEQPNGTEINDCLNILNGMIDAWNAERLMIFTVQRLTFVPAALQQAYTLGPGADFDTTRPARLIGYGVIILNNPVQPLELPLEILTDQQWQAIPVKNISSALPTKVWDDGGFPYRTLSYWPIPNATVNFSLYPWTALTKFADASTRYAFPPGYYEAIKYNLAVRLAGEGFGQASQLLLAGAMEGKARIKSINIDPIDLKVDQALIGRGTRGIYNWLSDTWVQK